jgi:DNA-binding beta-propeller fold protein YncE
MIRKQSLRGTLLAGSLAACAVAATPLAFGQLNSGEPQILSTNQTVTPLAPRDASYNALNPGLKDLPAYTVGQAVTTVVSPDKKTLLIITTGFNQEYYLTGPLANTGTPIPDDSTEWIFVYDIATSVPKLKQTISIPNTYCGIVFNPSGKEFYASGGDNDNVHIYDLNNGKWKESAASPVALGHAAGIGLEQAPEASGIAVSQDGKTLVVANYENDSISILGNSGSGWAKTGELDLRPGIINPADSGVPGGEFPFWVSIKGNGTAYVSSERDREIDVVSLTGTPTLTTRLKVTGNPNKSVLDKSQALLFVAEDNADAVAIIDTNTNRLLTELKTTAPTSVYANTNHYRGANPNSVELSPDQQTLYVTNAGENAVAVIKNPESWETAYVAGLIPTGFYPNSVSSSADGAELFIVNGKSATGPNPLNVSNAYGATSNEYDEQLTKAGFQTLPVPTDSELVSLTHQVMVNDNFFLKETPEQLAKVAELHNKIKHIIYIIKENRTYDQILGDLPIGDGDPSITQFGATITPNFHAIASNFVDFDNFYDVSDVSGDGWPWTTSARTTDTIEKEIPANYAGRGLSNNSEGLNRDLNVALATAAQREAADPFLIAFGLDNPNVLPGTANVAAPDSAEGVEDGGYIFNAVLNAGLTVRDYGQFIDIVPYVVPASEGGIAPITDPFATKSVVAVSSQPAIARFTDPYFRGFDNVFPDYYRFKEWDREFANYEADGDLPSLSLVRFMHDHTGNFGTAIAGVNTIELQEADNDYAVGLLADAVAHSPRYASNTLICVIEDDAQDGGDHVDAHRSTFYFIGPYLKHGYVDSTRYNTVNVLRTIEDILGTRHLNLNDAHALPMLDAFDLSNAKWTYNATPSPYLASTELPIPASAYPTDAKLNYKSLHDSKWWAEQTRGMDFTVEDHLDTPKYNRLVWVGTMGNRPYPEQRSGKNLRDHREQLLSDYKKQQAAPSTSKPASTVSANGGNE